MIYQNTSNDQIIQKYGCYFMCLAHAAGADTNHESLQDFYDWAFTEGLMTQKCYILKPHLMATHNLVITHWKCDSHYHFTMNNYDPIADGSWIAKYGHIAGYRVILHGDKTIKITTGAGYLTTAAGYRLEEHHNGISFETYRSAFGNDDLSDDEP